MAFNCNSLALSLKLYIGKSKRNSMIYRVLEMIRIRTQRLSRNKRITYLQRHRAREEVNIGLGGTVNSIEWVTSGHVSSEGTNIDDSSLLALHHTGVNHLGDIGSSFNVEVNLL
jgi:hypothetical protein